MTVQPLLVGILQRWVAFFDKDLAHTTEEQAAAIPGGAARPALEFVAECGAFCGMVARIVNGEHVPYPDADQRKAYYATVTSKEKALAILHEGADALAATIGGLSDEDLMRDTMAPWGQPLKVVELLAIAVTHVAYHSGQLNYLQLLNGDTAVHWLD